MKFCGNCGKQHEDSARFCTQCGTAFAAEASKGAAAPVAPEASTQYVAAPPVVTPSAKNTEKKIIALVAALGGVFVIGLIIALVVFFGGRNDTREQVEETPTPEPAVVAATPTPAPTATPTPTPEPTPAPSQVSGRIVAAGNHSIAVKDDGTIMNAGWAGRPINLPSGDKVHFEALRNVKKITGYNYDVATLHEDGTVSTSSHFRDLGDLTGITDIALGSSHLLALKEDGTVIAYGYDTYGETLVDGWRDIVAVYAGRSWSVGLKSNGTVVATGENDNSQCDVSSWRNVVSIVIGTDYTLGITSGGKILGVGSEYWTDWEGEKIFELSEFEGCVQVAGGFSHFAGLLPDGTVIARGLNYSGQCDVEQWSDIVKIAADEMLTVGLRADGTMLFAGEHSYAQYDPNLMARGAVDVYVANSFIGWLNEDGTVGITGYGFFDDLRHFPSWLEFQDITNIIAVAAGDGFQAALTEDGTVQLLGDNSEGQWIAYDWEDIASIAAGRDFLLGLKDDGTVISTNSDPYRAIDVYRWRDITAIAAGYDFAVGLKNDGTVVGAGSNYSGQLDVQNWSDIVSISAGHNYTVGVKSDGTCIIAGGREHNSIDVFAWTNVIKTASSRYLTAGLREGGTVLVTGDLGWGESRVDTRDWTDIVDIAVGDAHVLGLRSDGTVVASGSNEFGQIEVGSWVLW